MKLRGWVLPTLLLLGAGGAGFWFFQGPARTVEAIQDAIRQRDTVALTEHIDFPQLRTRVKDRAVRGLVAQTPVDDTPLETLAVLAGPALIAPLVDRALTPEGLMGSAMTGSALFESVSQALNSDPKVRLEGHDRAQVTLTHPNGNLVLFLVRDGLTWRVVDATMEGITLDDVAS